MADPRAEQTADFRRTIESGPAMGQNADGTFDTFPLADLAKRTAQRASDEEATGYAMEQSEEGFPEDQPEDFADLSDAADQDPV